ncbi:MAG: DUF3524 domain-containing protein [Chitinophagales bacterium]|nr:DUF3524 domain-containing protein [Chitinophagales bacterium]
MKIVLLEPYFAGSHRSWAEGYRQHSRHQLEILSLPGSHWKWRMHGGAISLAKRYIEQQLKPDLILATDMLDLNLFLSLTRKVTANIPTAIYFHENQLTYPWSPKDEDTKQQRDNHYSFINYASALTADRVFFNSQYHCDTFLQALPAFLKAFPDHQETDRAALIKAKSSVLHLGLDLKAMDAIKPPKPEKPNRAVILWNHRWEYDKNPDFFFKVLTDIAERGVEFKAIILGQQYGKQPECFEHFRNQYADRILHYGYVASREEYVKWLCMADILPVTSQHDFFGASIVEAMYCDVIPLLPNRLAYPEHLPKQFHRTFFYDKDDELTNRLQRMIFDVRVLRPQKVAHFIEKYDWSSLSKLYDEQLEGVTKPNT